MGLTLKPLDFHFTENSVEQEHRISQDLKEEEEKRIGLLWCKSQGSWWWCYFNCFINFPHLEAVLGTVFQVTR